MRYYSVYATMDPIQTPKINKTNAYHVHLR